MLKRFSSHRPKRYAPANGQVLVAPLRLLEPAAFFAVGYCFVRDFAFRGVIGTGLKEQTVLKGFTISGADGPICASGSFPRRPIRKL